ncbi:type II toxin-antitoxin system Phd/YefM family antitoxin [Paracoccus sp. 22332]|uniref:type II toxin-antitoxin system Phd/YefM family antitoxin n=1 Tax=Paracoccus sp. 22332 TaxID=3453913 RepID=UPI003F86CA4B
MWTLQDAKNRFSAVVDAALAGQPQQVSRRGKPAVVVLSMAEYDQMRQAVESRRGSFLQHLLDFPGLDDGSRPLARPRDVDF